MSHSLWLSGWDRSQRAGILRFQYSLSCSAAWRGLGVVMTDADRELAEWIVDRLPPLEEGRVGLGSQGDLIRDALKWRALMELGEMGVHMRPTENETAEGAGRYVFETLKKATAGGI